MDQIKHIGSASSIDLIEDAELFEYLSNKRIALIGPALTLHMSILESKIDICDVICRLNHHMITEPKLFEDYGSRNDLVFSDPNIIYYKYGLLKQVKPKFLCFPRYDPDEFGTHKQVIETIRKNYEKLLPQPQVVFAIGFRNLNPPFIKSFEYSNVD